MSNVRIDETKTKEMICEGDEHTVSSLVVNNNILRGWINLLTYVE